MTKENTALYTVAEFVYQVIKNCDHVRALENMDLSDEGLIEDLKLSGFFDLLPELKEVLGGDHDE